MAVESQTSVAEAAPLNGYLQDDVDCDELIATVYGTHLHIHIILLCFLTFWLQLKLNDIIALHGTSPQSYRVSRAIWDCTVLPATILK